MDTIFVIGQAACIAGLAYGAWVCFREASRYDADTARADAAASRAARTRGHTQPAYPPLDLAA